MLGTYRGRVADTAPTRGPPCAALRRILALLVAARLLAGACATEADERPSASTSRATGFDLGDDLDEEIDEPIAPDTGARGRRRARRSDEVVEAALVDVEAFWEPQLRGPLRRAATSRSRAASGPTGPTPSSPRAATPRPTYEDIAENAFYCPRADLIAWDNVNLVPGLYEEFGGFTLGIVFAHEFGHAIQTRARHRGARS